MSEVESRGGSVSTKRLNVFQQLKKIKAKCLSLINYNGFSLILVLWWSQILLPFLDAVAHHRKLFWLQSYATGSCLPAASVHLHVAYCPYECRCTVIYNVHCNFFHSYFISFSVKSTKCRFSEIILNSCVHTFREAFQNINSLILFLIFYMIQILFDMIKVKT